MRANNIQFNEQTYEKLAAQGKTVVFVLKENILLGMVALADIIRESSYKVIKELNDRGIETIMMTGDNNKVENYVGEKLVMTIVIADVFTNDNSNNIMYLNITVNKVL